MRRSLRSSLVLLVLAVLALPRVIACASQKTGVEPQLSSPSAVSDTEESTPTSDASSTGAPADAPAPAPAEPGPTATTVPSQAPKAELPPPAGPAAPINSIEVRGDRADVRGRTSAEAMSRGLAAGMVLPGTDKNEKAMLPDPEEKPAQPGGTFVHAGTNPFVSTAVDPLSTFAIDVDTGSLTFARRHLRQGNLPPAGAVRVEEWVNAMNYTYAPPPKDAAVPFAIHTEGAPSPISQGRHVVRVALKGKEVGRSERAPTSLVFLVDVSGSMEEPDKLPLAREALHLLTNQLREDDQVGIVTYAGDTRVALPLTSASSKSKIHAAIDTLRAGGGTNMGSGMELAYREAQKGLGGGRSARVIVLSDGDANIGRTNHQQILDGIRGYVSEGVMMSTVGFGTGNYNDYLMEQLADAGNGNYSYVDSMKTAQKVFVDSIDGTLETIAQDVKIQVEWNKDVVASYRLLGYENRDVADRDFRNDKKDAGEIGAGHSVTALYEVELTSSSPLGGAPLGTVRVRAKKPRGTRAEEVQVAIPASVVKERARDLDADGRAAVAVALAAEILRHSPYAEGRTLSEAAALLQSAAAGPFADERRELANELLRVEPRFASLHR